MQVSRKELFDMRRQLEADRETCAGSPLAQKYLDECAQLQTGLAEDLAANYPEEIIGVTADVEHLIGADNVTPEELESHAASLHKWQEQFDEIPGSEHNTASYQVAQECLQILKRNYVRLYYKNQRADLVGAEIAPLENTVKV